MKSTLLAFLMCITLTANGQTMSLEKEDNQLHLASGMVIGSGAIILNEKVFDEAIPDWTASIGSAFLAGFVKETIDELDKNPHNKFNWSELGWTVIGGAVSYGLHELGVPKALTMGLGISFVGIKMSF